MLSVRLVHVTRSVVSCACMHRYIGERAVVWCLMRPSVRVRTF